MAEEFKKYKDILVREQKEFREEMEREVSTFLPFQLDRERQDLNQVKSRFCNKFCKKFFFFWILWSALSNIIFGYYSRA